MQMQARGVAVGVFANRQQANQAVLELERAGFDDKEIGFLTGARTDEADATAAISNNAVSGAAGGSLIGGILGAAASLIIPGIGPAIAGGILAATLGGAALGAAAGGLISVLMGLGATEDEAKYYQKEIQAGRSVIVVKAPDSYQAAMEILKRSGALNARTEEAVYDQGPLPRGGSSAGAGGDLRDPSGPAPQEL